MKPWIVVSVLALAGLLPGRIAADCAPDPEVVIAVALWWGSPEPPPIPDPLQMDLNGDGTVDVVDVQMAILHSFDTPEGCVPSPQCVEKVAMWFLAGQPDPKPACIADPMDADLNGDGSVNVTDVLIAVKLQKEGNQAPEAHVYPKLKSVAPGSLVRLSGLKSNDPDAIPQPLQFEWTGPAGELLGTASTLMFVAPSLPGIYTVKLTVSDGLASDSDVAKIKVK